MSAKRADYARVQEIYDVVTQTQRQIGALGFNEKRFASPANDTEDLIAEGIMNRVFRVTEEAGHVSEETALRYGFDRAGINGVRNRLAHAYGEVDRTIIWSVIKYDFPELLSACQRYCADKGIELG